MILEALQWIAIALSLTGTICINKKKKVGFYIWMVSNSIWITSALSTQHWQQVVLFGIYIVLCFHGLYNWKTQEAA